MRLTSRSVDPAEKRPLHQTAEQDELLLLLLEELAEHELLLLLLLQDELDSDEQDELLLTEELLLLRLDEELLQLLLLLEHEEELLLLSLQDEELLLLEEEELLLDDPEEEDSSSAVADSDMKPSSTPYSKPAVRASVSTRTSTVRFWVILTAVAAVSAGTPAWTPESHGLPGLLIRNGVAKSPAACAMMPMRARSPALVNVVTTSYQTRVTTKPRGTVTPSKMWSPMARWAVLPLGSNLKGM